MQSEPNTAQGGALRWVEAALWGGLLLAALRGATLFAMERLAHGGELAEVQRRLASALPSVALRALVLAAGGALLVALAARAAGAARRAALAAATLALTAGALVLLTGRLADDASREIGLETARGQAATAVLALLALLFAATFTAAALRLRRGGAARALVPALALVLLPVGWRAAFGELTDEMTIREVVRELLAGEPTWDTVQARDDRAPAVGVISPSLSFRLRGGDIPALVLPPPAEVRLAPEAEDLPALLEFRAGVDHSVLHGATKALVEQGCAIHFELEVDGELRFSADVDLTQDDVAPGTEWVDGEPLPLRAGQAVTLRTSMRRADGSELVPDVPVKAGFGGLKLTRRFERERIPSSPSAPNIVLIVMDTQRADRLSVYGYERETSPNLARLAERGIVYDNAYSTASWTWPSTASILTGLQPQEHGVLNETSCFLSEALVTLPEVLQRRGFTTAGWSANQLIVPDKNFDQGFEFFEYAKGSVMRSEVLMPEALEWVEAIAGTRFFLYLQLLDPHSPLDPLEEGRRLFAPDVPRDFSSYSIEDYKWPLLENCGHTPQGEVVTNRCVPPEHQRWISDQYDACVWSGDYWVGLLLDKLAELQLDEETIVVFTSDHGEELFEHGQLSHGQCLFSPSVRIPLVLAGPGIPRGNRVETPVSNRHLAPSLARLAGIEWSPVADARDLSRPDELPLGDVMFSTYNGWWNGEHRTELLGLRSHDRVLLYAPDGKPWSASDPTPEGDWVLYDLGADHDERRNLAAEQPSIADALRERLIRLDTQLEERRSAPTVEAGDSTLQMLRDIGYLGDG
ncbi:MAG: sulfatase [Planctomycetota bacterium]